MMTPARTIAQRRRAPPETSVAIRFLEMLAAIHSAVCVTTRNGQTIALAEGLAQGIATMETCARGGRKLIFIGNGGSAAIASHQAVDYWKNGGFEAVAFNDASLLTCIGNDYGFDQVFAQPIRRFAKAEDLLIAVSSSGRSSNILRGVEAAYDRGCEVLTLSGFGEDNPLRRLGALNFYVPSHAYGIVEVTHLSLLHAMLDDAIARKSHSTLKQP